jgi:transposase, IS5 family
MRRPAEQLTLRAGVVDHPRARLMEQVSQILREKPETGKRIEQDLLRGVKNPGTGARGMTGEQVLRVLIVKQMNELSYDELAFALADSQTYRSFCGYGPLDEVPSRSTLQENLKKLRAETLEAVNRALLKLAAEKKIETGQKARIDSTVVEANIHVPSDSALLYDGVRVLSRLLARVQKVCDFAAWQNHTPSAKSRMREIHSTRSTRKQQASYRKLLAVARATSGYTRAALFALRGVGAGRRPARLRKALSGYRELLERVIEQTERRVLHGEKTPAAKRVISLFEPHADVIVKDHNKVHYGHKINLCGGASGLILDCVIERGNPNDATRAVPMLERQRAIYGVVPRQVAFDGNYTSEENLRQAKEMGVKDVCFTRRRGLEIEEMASSTRIYRLLKRFRAGVEATISYLKRVFGLTRCTWRGEESFQSYVWSSVVTANLVILARHLLE